MKKIDTNSDKPFVVLAGGICDLTTKGNFNNTLSYNYIAKIK